MLKVPATTGPRLAVAIHRVGKRAVVDAAGEIDAGTAPVLDGALDRAVATGALEVWLNLGPTQFMDSTGLHLVLRLRTRLVELRRTMSIICPRGPVRRVFELAGVDRALPLYTTLAAAQRAS